VESLFGIPMDTLMVIFLVAFVIVLAVVAVLALRNRVLLTLGLRNIARRRGRATLIVAGLMLGTVIITSAFNIGDTMSHTIRSSVLTSLGNTDELISVEGADADISAIDFQASPIEYFDETLFQRVDAAIGDSKLVDALTPAIIEAVAVQDTTSRQNEPRVTLFAADPDRMAGLGEIKEVGGGAVSLGDLGPGEVYLNDEAADQLNAGAGDEIQLFAASQSAGLHVKSVVRFKGSGTDESAMLMPLDAAQRLLGKEGQIKHILVSNQGNALSGAKHTDAVIAAAEPTLTPLNLQISPIKQDALDLADTLGSTFMSFFIIFGLFSIVAGILLIFLIFVMLAEERKSEMGIARAVGTKRSHLIQMFLHEGVTYDLVAAAIGALLGVAVAYGMVFIMARAFATFGISIEHDLRTRSLIVAFTMGMLLTFLVVTVSAWRVSVLNIVAAVRNLPEPAMHKKGRAALIVGALALLLGSILIVAGLGAEQATPFYLGVSLLIVGPVPLLRRFGVPDRAAYTIPGLVLVAFWLLPFDTLGFILPDLGQDFSLFVVSGIMLVLGGTWVVMYNSDLILRAVMAVFGRIRFLTPILKTAVSYPLTSRFRTGTTLAMFTLVVFTMVVMATTNNAFTEAFNDEDAFGGGFDVRATVAPANPIGDIESAIAQSGTLNADDFAVTSSQSFMSLELMQAGIEGKEFESYPVRGLDDAFLANNTYQFAAMAEGYHSAEEVWRAVAENPGLAVADALPVPRRDNFGFQFQTDFRLEGLFIEDKTFSPIDLRVSDPQTSTKFDLTIIGVLKDTAPEHMIGVSTSQRKLDQVFIGNRAQPTVYLFALKDGVDPGATADALESAFLANGLEAESLSTLLNDLVGTNLTFSYVLQGFMGLGLVVGVAALGVISARSVVERRQQIGVLRSIGFKQGMVQLSFLLESSFITLLSIVIGSVLGLVVSFNVIADAAKQASWENIGFDVPWLNLIIIFAIVYLASLLTTFVPARQASRVYPAQALRYE
jgi:putative ABC transport system permease protein